jgi:Putative multicopper oxidases
MFFILTGGGGINHPFHMHGYYFNVIAMGKFKNGRNEDHVIEDLRRGTLKISKSPAFKDTIAVPASGYSVIRILADNPGKHIKCQHYINLICETVQFVACLATH